MLLFSADFTLPVVTGDLPESVCLALRDLRRDFLAVSGQEDGFPMVSSWNGVALRTEIRGGVAESAAVTVTEDGITVTGGDALGAIYGIYSISQRLLGVDPFYAIADLPPVRSATLSVKPCSWRIKPSPVRYRGWFLNDEDLLSEFHTAGGTRELDYPHYHHVMAVPVLDRVLEAALRLGLNLVLPGSFLDICNPAERALVEAVCRRGLYVTTHHIEPLGVSHFTAERELGKASFAADPRGMERIWRKYAKAWSAYGDHVLWQLGLRGRGDMPVWKTDPSVADTPAARGKLMGDAIALQYRIVRETLGSADFTATVTLWEEGAELYRTGYLPLPEKALIVFADVGIHQMLGEDFYEAPHRQPCGVYYHVAYWAWGPHLAEGCSDEKQVWNYRRLWEEKCLSYSILNVANLREVHMGARLNAAILREPADFELHPWQEKTFAALYGEQGGELLTLRREYFSAFAELGETDARWYATEKHSAALFQYENLPFVNVAVTDGMIAALGKRNLKGMAPLDDDLPRRLAVSRDRFAALYEKLEALEPQIPENRRRHFCAFPRLQALYLRNLLAWALAPWEGVGYLREIDRARRKALPGWYDGDRKLNLHKLMELSEGGRQEQSKKK